MCSRITYWFTDVFSSIVIKFAIDNGISYFTHNKLH